MGETYLFFNLDFTNTEILDGFLFRYTVNTFIYSNIIIIIIYNICIAPYNTIL